MTIIAPKAATSRDHRIDFWRGVALVMIFFNHVPGTLWENFTSRNFGFSDAAELFVFLAGFAAAFAYGRPFLAGNRLIASVKAFRVKSRLPCSNLSARSNSMFILLNH